MRVTIVGGGFAGVKAAIELAKRHVNVTLISDHADFQYYPALYGTATGRSHLQVWVPLGQIFAGFETVRVVIDRMVSLDSERKIITGESGTDYSYTTLILALGSVTTYFGIEGLDTYAYGIKSEAEIKRLKAHLAAEFMHAETLDKHVVVIGAGPTGVELSSALGTYLNHLHRYYKVPQRKMSIDLVEAAPRVLPRMNEKTSQIVTRRLQKLGVTVEVGKTVNRQTTDELIVAGRPIKSRTVIWTSGTANHPFFAEHADIFTLAKNGRVIVDDQLRAAPHIYVIGDNASNPYGGLAQTALRDAGFVARNLTRRHPHAYTPKQPPVVVPVGENWAVFEYKKLYLYGYVASLIRSVADVVGYHDILPIGQALGVWRSHKVYEDDYFEPLG
jgi:NADH dehydrogenase